MRSIRLAVLLVAVVSLMGCCGFGFSMPDGNHRTVVPQNLLPTSNLSFEDSLIQEMVEFIGPDVELSKKQRRNIEKRIKGFPHRIIRRDTAKYFLETAYAVAYYEFSKKDYKKAYSYCVEFKEKVMPPFLGKSLPHYSSVQFNAFESLRTKGKIKSKKDKNSWHKPIKTPLLDSLSSFRRSYVQFLDSFIDDMPLDCDISTYHKVLSLYHDGGGKLEWLNSFLTKGFFQRCLDERRPDILNVVYRLWGVSEDDFEADKANIGLKFKFKPIAVDTAAVRNMFDLMLLFSIDKNINKIDSLVVVNGDASNHVLQLLNICYSQNRFNLLTKYCKQYNTFVYGAGAVTLQNYWGLGCSYMGKYDEALMHYDMALSRTHNPEVHSTIRLNKACALGEMGRTEDAVDIFFKEKDNQNTPFEKFCWNDNLGHVYSFVDPAKALTYFTQAERYLDKSTLYEERKVRHYCRKARVLTSNNYLRRLAIDKALEYTGIEFASKVAKGMAYTELGVFNNASFNYEEADKNYNEAYRAYEWLIPEDYRMCYLNINHARNLCSSGRYHEAVDILSKQLELQDSVYGENCMESLQTLQVLVSANARIEEKSRLSALFERYVGLSQRFPAAVSYYDDLIVKADYYAALDQDSVALSTLQKGLSGHLTALQRIDISCRLEQLARTLCNKTEYASLCSSMIAPLKHDIVESLLLLTDDDRKELQRPLQSLLDGLLAGGDIEDALALCLFRKGLLFATKQSVEKKLAKNRRTKKDYRRLTQLRSDLNNAVAYCDTLHIPTIQTSVTQLERKLNHLLASDKDLFSSINRRVSQVKSRLGENDFAVDFIRYNEDGMPRYGAFGITAAHEPVFVNLGSEKEIAEDMSKVWSGLTDYLNVADDIYFCTDGILNNLGIEFAQVDGKPVNSKYRLHRVFHLTEIENGGNIGTDIVAIGVSDYNSPIGMGETLYRGNLTDLPNVKYELDLISRHLDAYDPTIIFNDDATEEKVKALNQSCSSVLHFSTHGFYRGEEVLRAAASDSDNFDCNMARRFLSSDINSVSGLVLRRGNLSWQAREILEDEDDILTAEEIENMSFPNLRLTVLSACESGLGDVDSDGVWGLQRAFRIAGSKSLICSLRKVPDYETALFMDAFYEKAGAGESIYDSFHHAQLVLYDEYPDHPEIWSSFILIE